MLCDLHFCSQGKEKSLKLRKRPQYTFSHGTRKRTLFSHGMVAISFGHFNFRFRSVNSLFGSIKYKIHSDIYEMQFNYYRFSIQFG